MNINRFHRICDVTADKKKGHDICVAASVSMRHTGMRQTIHGSKLVT